MYKTKTMLLCMIVGIFVIQLSCSDSGVESQPGTRNYEWSVDTVRVPLFYVWSLWGSSAVDIWTVTSNGENSNGIYHFDGVNWENDGIARYVFPNSVFGLNKNFVFTGGGGGIIWFYDGNTWEHSYSYPENGGGVVIENIWGISTNEIYAVGFIETSEIRRGLILRYNGSNWQEVDIPTIPYDFHKIRKGNNTNYCIYASTLQDSIAVFELNGRNLTPIYNELYTDDKRVGIQTINNELYIVVGNIINKYNGSDLVPVVDVDNSLFALQIWGRSDKDIFLAMTDGFAHYNGIDIEYLYQFPYDESRVVDAALFENEVFFLGLNFNLGVNLIYRGKIEE